MATKLKINGVIGYEISSKDFNAELDKCTGDVDIEINSPGGYVYDGISIFNAIKNYDKGNTKCIVSGESCSMSSIIMLAGNKLEIEANSSVMIHNPSNFAWGDYQVMRDNADTLEKTAIMMAKIYESKTDYTRDEIQALMDKQTYFIGSDELKAWGTVIGEQNQDDEDIEARAKTSFMAMCDKLKSQNIDAENFKALKMLVNTTKSENKPANKVVKNPQGKEKIMDLKELKQDHPDVYAQALALGAQNERERVEAHLEFMDVAPETAVKAIKEGIGFTQSITAKYLRAGINKGEITSMENGNQDPGKPPIPPAAEKTDKEKAEEEKEKGIRAEMTKRGLVDKKDGE